MTERVKAASLVAVQTAIEHADDPRILEVTIDLGKLEGMWALLFGRREDKQREHTRLVADPWRPLIDRDAVAAMVDTFRAASASPKPTATATTSARKPSPRRKPCCPSGTTCACT
ncbi:hypothetical protein N8I84_42070 (plasmid) [Streptomyces cynarae]|uniref:Uncharacterized protein n=1 Tax=Streptomyces cynarae TaxID=2981134 RepID=A0ABY6EGU7_9ACTN|nr:hypothetical protein [Streptomyces cynarae]UXY25016.1 hypothetical protein N8I84_42070 [Streptomyces cynarae]